MPVTSSFARTRAFTATVLVNAWVRQDRTLNLRIKSLSCTASLTSGFDRILFLTCGSLFRLVPVVHGCYWLARGFFVGSGWERTPRGIGVDVLDELLRVWNQGCI